ncbi:MAG: excalibur calcium-binding domain-containing protein [Ilumatobacteraceae bacterium]
MHRSPTTRTLPLLALALALVACGGTEGPITLASEAPAASTVPVATDDPVVTTVVPGPTSTTSASGSPSTTATPALSSSTTVAAASPDSAIAVLAALTIAAEQPLGYDRDLFRHWIDADGDGCDTRAEVLIDESLGLVQRDYPCAVREGDWYSSYDGLTWTDPSEIDIDHVVALSEAWRSGAWQWSAVTREAFANDLTDERTLIAVTDSTNSSKGDDDPSDWLPPRDADTCRFVGDWLSVKLRWDLSVDPDEHDAIESLLEGQCAGLTIAPVTPPPASTAAVVTEIPVVTSAPSGGGGSGSGGDVYYPNCAAVRAAGMDPLYVGDPGYRSGLDRDGDGVACE